MKDKTIFEKNEEDDVLKIFMEWQHSDRKTISLEDLIKECGFSHDEEHRRFQPAEDEKQSD